MSSYVIRDLPPGVIHRAKLRAVAEGTTLEAQLRQWLEAYGRERESERSADTAGPIVPSVAK